MEKLYQVRKTVFIPKHNRYKSIVYGSYRDYNQACNIIDMLNRRSGLNYYIREF